MTCGQISCGLRRLRDRITHVPYQP